MLSYEEFSKGVQNLRSPQPTKKGPEKRNLIESLLPAGGAIAGSIIGTPIFGGAIGGGIGEFLAQLLNKEKVNPLSVGQQGFMGGVGGGVGKLFGLGREVAAGTTAAEQLGAEAAGKGAANVGTKAATQAVTEGAPDFTAQVAKLTPKTMNRGIGTTIRQAGLKPANELSPWGLSNKAEQASVQRDFNLSGAPSVVAEKSQNALTTLDTATHSYLKNLDTINPINPDELATKAVNDFNSQLTKELSRYKADPNFKQFKIDFTKRIAESTKTGSREELYALKKAVADENSQYLAKVNSGQAMNLPDTLSGVNFQVNNSAYKALKTTLDAVAPATTRANNTEGILYDLLYAGQKGGQQGVNLPIVNKILSRPIQAGADFVGRGIQAAENIPGVQTAGRTLLPAATGQGVANATMGGFGGGQEQPPQDALSQLSSQQPSPNPTDMGQAPASANGGLSLDANTAAQLVLAYPKYSSQIMAAFNLLNPKPAATQQADVFIQKATDNIDSLLGGGGSLGEGPVAGGIAGASIQHFGGTGVSQDTVGLNQRYQLLKLNILRAYQGARISDADFKLANLYTPSISDTPQTAQTKLTVLRDILLNSTPTAQTGNPGTTTPVTPDVLSQFGQ